jgi:hypothetical protein
MIFEKYSEDKIRNISRQSLETLAYWLRQVVEESMTAKYGNNYFDAVDTGGSLLLPVERINTLKARQSAEKDRYVRLIDAAFLEDLIAILCQPDLYKAIFNKYFKFSYPNGVSELRNVLNKLIDPQNRLTRADPITHRQAEQVICYSHDITDAIKYFYSQHDLHMEFNVPRIIRFKDSFGNEVHFDKSSKHSMISFIGKKAFYLRPEDTLALEVEIDNSFSEEEYTIEWRSIKKIPNFGNAKKISFLINEQHVGEELSFQCVLTSNKSWHRMQQGYDDLLLVWYTVLPGI